MDAGGLGETPIWTPSPARVARSELRRYERWLEAERGLRFADYGELWRWSIADLDAFWRSIVEFFAVRIEDDPGVALAESRMPGAVWFPGARLSYVERMFAGRDPAATAIFHASELEPLGQISWAELERRVARFAAGLRALGIGRGDRVAAYLPNSPETVIAFLATASLGAVWSCCSPDLGAGSVRDRFAQVEPKLLLAVDGYRYRGRDHDRRAVIESTRAALGSLQHTVVLSQLGAERPAGTLPWEAVAEHPAGALEPQLVPFDHPLWILYTSGTTGLPKAIVHGHGGILLEQLKRTGLHVDAKPGDCVLWYTTTGWMMWNFLVGVMLTGSAVVLYDGDPLRPRPEVLWELCEASGATCFGAGSAYFLRLAEAGFAPRQGRRLDRLDAVGTTGSPFPPEGYEWLQEQLGSDVWVFSGSGGTDVCTSFVGGVPGLPVYAGEMQGPSLGVDVQVWDEHGKRLERGVGEMVIAQPMPSMPLGFWGDRDGSRLREAYFEQYPGAWRHGDWLELTPRGTAIVHGRSDSTINRGGVRIGSSEIYRAVAAVPETTEALVVDLPEPGGEGWMGLFVALAEGERLSAALRDRIAAQIRLACSPRHVPDEIVAVPEVPRTLTGKVVEVPVKRILMGADPAAAVSREALANPAAIDWFAEYARTRQQPTHI